MNATLVVEMIALGIAASFLGSIVGLGGAFVAIPVLRLLFHLPPKIVAGTSLFLVVANVGSASIAFWRQRRIDFRLGFTLGLLAIPGNVLGAIALQRIPTRGFDLAYGAILVVFAFDLLRRGTPKPGTGAVGRLPWSRPRTFFDAISGTTYEYEDSPPMVAVAGLVTGFLASFFGIGGGVLVVPLLMRGFLLPAHIVSATSHFIILLSSPFGVVAHALNGDVDWNYAIPLAIGGIVGAQIGAALSKRLSTPVLVRTLAIVLLVAAGSLALQHVI